MRILPGFVFILFFFAILAVIGWGIVATAPKINVQNLESRYGGCVTPIETYSPMQVRLEAHGIETKTSPVPTAVPVTASTTVKIPPLPSTISLSGGPGDTISRFSTQASGSVKFVAESGQNLGPSKTICKGEPSTITLSGKTIYDTEFLSGKISGKRTLLLPRGDFSISTTGCYNWKVTISNA